MLINETILDAIANDIIRLNNLADSEGNSNFGKHLRDKAKHLQGVWNELNQYRDKQVELIESKMTIKLRNPKLYGNYKNDLAIKGTVRENIKHDQAIMLISINGNTYLYKESEVKP